jgi:outer membrane receptor protein involved in Fe transport
LSPFSPYRFFLIEITLLNRGVFKETKMKTKHALTTALILTTSISLAAFSQSHANDSPPIEELLVTAELLENNLLELPNSVSIIDADLIAQRTAHHLEDLLNLAPNVNFASGASRGRFIQIRGIGERSEFQEPIINSVGVIVDGIDFTGIATAASMLDIKQVEVLRGPQGTLFGANALAGMINIVSNRPSESPYAKASMALEDFSGFELGGVVSGQAGDDSAYRVAVKHYENDGFSENIFLARDDTNNIDETTARARIVSQISDRLELDASLFMADINNGYDSFSLDNTRQTYSDRPGYDRQDTTGGSIKANYKIDAGLSFEGLISLAKSELEYSYDEDWAHDGICNGTACDSSLFGFDWFYSSFDSYQRNNDNTSIDLKLVSRQVEKVSWVAGLYHRAQDIDLLRRYTFNDGDFRSELQTDNTALYGQLDFAVNHRWSLSAGLRFEQRDSDYTDNASFDVSTDENLWGGRIALEYLAQSGAFYYGLISRGYKAGGFNLDGSISLDQRQFDSETMLNYEFGVKNSLLDDTLQLQFAAFYQDRDDIQSKQSIVSSIATNEVGGACPCNFTDFTANAASGTNRGVELEFNYLVSAAVTVFGSLGLLDTEFDELLTFDHVSADRDNGVPYNLDGREQAHAPRYQWFLGAAYHLSDHWSISGSIEAKDDFLFSDRHEERSDAYELLNLELSYSADNWQVALYGKNINNELVKTRGFGSFGNDPRKFYATEPYNQFAAPRVVGVKASIQF